MCSWIPLNLIEILAQPVIPENEIRASGLACDAAWRISGQSLRFVAILASNSRSPSASALAN